VGRDVVIEENIADISIVSGQIALSYSAAFSAGGFSSTNDITEDLIDPLFFNNARSVSADDPPRGVEAETLVSGSRSSWAEDNLALFLRQGMVSRADSRIRSSVPLVQLLEIDVAEHPAIFTPTEVVVPEGAPATLIPATPEEEMEEAPAVEPTEPVGVSDTEAEIGLTLDEPSPGGAVDAGGREPSPEETATMEPEEEPEEEEPEIAQAEEEVPEDVGPARLIVIGDVSLLDDELMVPGRTGNRDFILNAVNFLAADTALIAIRPRDNINTGFMMSALDWRVLIILLIAMPLTVALVGVVVAVRRRRLA
jgi:hypothetical protein